MLSSLALLVFPLLMAFAASSDLLTMRISNRLVLVLMAAFFVVAVAAGMPLPQIGLHVAAALLALAVSFAFFAPGWIGGGDAKLAAATALWIGFGALLPYVIYAALLGGALTLTILVARRWPLPASLIGVHWIGRLHDSKAGVPYGIALAVAGIIVYRDTAIFQHLAT
ncbi:MAG: prepilin peptidase [Devosia sp.]|nr:prepilin peptidase [Devosia sp.]